ncbi:CapA family protein [Carboxylicivirga sp. M1479]|uniref:CapA family protein n=1 Tax=Carboxylicivirga sp. M1479 TaxID=2594476 RepID=UPI00117787EF|nr:CapA family protein [Carboxylicivirga sp. M1479]TRX72359.1 CapA family protein [Carboxylicivirga sp. M1479]
MRFIFLSIFLTILKVGFAQDSLHVAMVFMGDVMGHDSQINSARIKDSDRYDYNSCFKYIKDDILSADIAIANLEVTLAGKPYKGYPTFSSPDTLANALISAGIDGLVMANNHCVDRKKAGLERTCNTLDKLGIPRTGVFKDSLDRIKNNPMILEANGIKIAVLSYTYGTNGIRVQSPNIVNQIDTAIIAEDIRLTRRLGVDEVIVCMHWGWEYQTKPNPEQKRLTSFLQSKGIRVIVGSHPHVLQPMNLQSIEGENSLIANSMGNFISNQRTAPRDGAALLFVELLKVGDTVQVVKAEYQLTWVYTPVYNGKKSFYVLPAERYRNANWIDETARKRLNEYLVEGRAILKSNINVEERSFTPTLNKKLGSLIPTTDISSINLDLRN